jgi:hypothetical protein
MQNKIVANCGIFSASCLTYSILLEQAPASVTLHHYTNKEHYISPLILTETTGSPHLTLPQTKLFCFTSDKFSRKIFDKHG